MEIKYFNKKQNSMVVEKVYGDKFIKWLYQSNSGKALSNLVCRAPLSILYGALQDIPFSKNKIDGFVENFKINMDEYIPSENGTSLVPYKTFNEFFIRRFKEGARNFTVSKNLFPAFAEAKYLCFDSVTPEMTFPIKGKHFSAKQLLNNETWGKVFENGPMMIARLCPTDYHRFHFPDNGKVLESYKVKGKLHSVSPIALKEFTDILGTNKREVTIIETESFGKIAYIEVGAFGVGSIVQNYEGNLVRRGQEKGYFLFGGSTVIVLGEAGNWKPNREFLSRSESGIETHVELGDWIATGK